MNASLLLLGTLLLLLPPAALWLGRRLGKADAEGLVLPERRASEEAQRELRTQLALARQEGEHLDRQREALAREGRALRELLDQAQAALRAQEGQLGEAAEVRRTLEDLRAASRDQEDALAAARQEAQRAGHRIVELEAGAAKDREILARERAQLEEGRRVFRQEFESLAHRIFEEKHLAFDTRSQEGLRGLLAPFREQLEAFRTRVDEVHTENVQGHASLKGELERIRELNQQITAEASSLTRALKGDKKIQGTWGEQKVELLLELAGLRSGIEFSRERTFKDEEGNNLRPDFVVNLPEGKHIIIDSKVSLVDYAECVAAETPEARQRCLAAHVQALRNHIRTLGDKRYPDLPGMGSPDFTFLFIAIEPAYMAAAEHTPALFQEAYDRRIALVTATTLLPVLRVVANLWSLQRQNLSTRELADQASRVYDKLRIFLEKMEKLGHQFETAQRTYRDAFDTLKDGRGSLVRTVDRFVELGVKVVRRMPPALTGQALELDEGPEPSDPE